MASTRLLIEDSGGSIRAQLLDSPRLAAISSGDWDAVELMLLLESMGRQELARDTVRGITLRSAARSLSGLHGRARVRRALATEGALPRRLRRA